MSKKIKLKGRKHFFRTFFLKRQINNSLTEIQKGEREKFNFNSPEDYYDEFKELFIEYNKQPLREFTALHLYLIDSTSSYDEDIITEDIIDSELFQNALKKQIKYFIDFYNIEEKFYKDIKRFKNFQDPFQIYRRIGIKDYEDFIKELRGGVGIYWSWEENFNPELINIGSGEEILIVALVNKEEVDWLFTLVLRTHLYEIELFASSSYADEKEIRLYKGSKIKIVKIIRQNGEIVDLNTPSIAYINDLLLVEKSYERVFDDKLKKIKEKIQKEGITSHPNWREFINVDKMLNKFEEIIEERYSDKEELDEYYQYLVKEPFQEISKHFNKEDKLNAFLTPFIEDSLIEEYIVRTQSFNLMEIWDSDEELRRYIITNLFETGFLLKEEYEFDELVGRKWEDLPIEIKVYILAIEENLIE
jgi:hypothetical protein